MDSSPGLEVYESYETDYRTLAASIQAKLAGEAKEAKGGKSGGSQHYTVGQAETGWCRSPQSSPQTGRDGARGGRRDRK